MYEKMSSIIHQKGCKGIVAMKKMTEIKGHGMMELFTKKDVKELLQ